VDKYWYVAPQIQQCVHFDVALVERNGAHYKRDKHKSMVVESSA
jgi:hypothetical protein